MTSFFETQVFFSRCFAMAPFSLQGPSFSSLSFSFFLWLESERKSAYLHDSRRDFVLR
jgi:hypothetical protein